MSNDKKHVYGIDLGTTYSAISYVNEFGKAEIIKNFSGGSTTPSVVYFETANNIVVGEDAKDAGNASKEDAARVVDSVKRQMSNTDYTFEAFGKEYDPVAISALILKKMVNDAREAGHDVQDVVITCPAYFGELERSRTRQAGEAIGLNVVEIIDEPVAAALNYGLEKSDVKGKNVIVYDLGGGTFDVTVISIGSDPNRDEVKVVCTLGNHQLGGKDWDDCIVRYYIEQFKTETGRDILQADPEETHSILYDLQTAAEKNKKTLTNRESVSQKVSFEGKEVKIELTRAEFEKMTTPYFEQTVSYTDQLLELAKEKGITKINTFLLVGGSTKMPQIARKIEEKYGALLGIKVESFDPDEAVSKGAAKNGLIALVKSMGAKGKSDTEISLATGLPIKDVAKAKETVLVKVATKTYGIGVINDEVSNLIFIQSELPFEITEEYCAAGTTDTLVMSFWASDEEKAKNISQNKATRLVEKPFYLGQTVPGGTPVGITVKLSQENHLTLHAVVAGSAPFELGYVVEGARDEQEMNNLKKELASKNTT